MKILALGDCNTSGDVYFKNNAYPEKIANKLHKSLKNCGYTMSTTREMINFFNDFKTDDTEIILIQYGLVDSWKTFKYSPYVLYYPDYFIRKIFRKFVKKYKKICKILGLNDLIGVNNVVPIDEYKKNIEFVINNAKDCIIFLIDTVPNQDTSRNSEIQKYNLALQEIANNYKNVFKVNLYNDFFEKQDLYIDTTHLSQKGIELVASKLLNTYSYILEQKNK